eukprot:UN14482
MCNINTDITNGMTADQACCACGGGEGKIQVLKLYECGPVFFPCDDFFIYV